MNKFQNNAQPTDNDQDRRPQVSASAQDSGEVCCCG
jgi:hypothetical protein